MRAFLDFEASSLAKQSYPIEVAWVFEDGRSETFLIRPAPAWTDWDERAAAVHRLTRAVLLRDGVPHDEVARRLLTALGDVAVYASSPSWDGKWLSVLLRAAGLPRHALRLRDTDELQLETARAGLAAQLSGPELEAAAIALVAGARAEFAARPVAHRALPDAEQERQIWLEIARRAGAVSGSPPGRLLLLPR